MSDVARSLALQIYRAALCAADAGDAIRRNLRQQAGALDVGGHALALSDASRVVVVGAGKAGGRMALAVEEVLGDRVSGGLVSVKDGHGAPTNRIALREASHPLPDERSLANGRAILDHLQSLTASDVVLCLLSGGGSALMESLGEGLTLAHLRILTLELMHAGANIVDLNTVRKHISHIKGGQLARHAQPAAVCSLILSDVAGNDLSSIASGPTAPDATTFAESLSILDRFGLRRTPALDSVDAAPDLQNRPAAGLIADVVRYLERGERGELAETPKPGDKMFGSVHNIIIGDNKLGLEAMAREALTLAYTPEIVSTTLGGEARVAGHDIARYARARARSARHLCLLWGGETTVTVRGHGKGGRNHELALAAALELDGHPTITLLSAATDGGDGTSDAAGAVVDGKTMQRAREHLLDAHQALEQNDTDRFFSSLGEQIVTGPTFTNINDVVAVLIE